jgi:dihydrofolate reductase
MSGRPRISCFIATSADGYIAGPRGEIDWLFSDADYGYTAYFASVDAVVMGRATYETALGFGDWVYAGKRAWVLTNRPVTALPEVDYRSGDVEEVVADIARAGCRHVWLVGGGDVVGQFRRAGLVDEWIISLHPVLLGAGLPLFPPGLPRGELELLSAEGFPSGLVQVRYRTVERMAPVA